MILALVLGWENWGVKEYAAVLGGPVLYVPRLVSGTESWWMIANGQDLRGTSDG